MKDKLADFLVLFRRGEVTGIHNEREVELKEICNSLGGLDCKVFDPYMVYSNLADNGLLVRVETKNLDGSWSILFYYPVEKNKNNVRRKIINFILDEARYDYKLLKNGYAVVTNNNGNLKLACIRKSLKNTIKRKRKFLNKA
ncbi:hypothetical protein [Desulfoscipio gibsoniae]|uniref:Uncharacterized protein n=1 Tax=Desulfoscipio gibsoniae DSM 7213 TaxID=767817 RepID=R4KET2_9FIRM|nr:hypothetical protein [Desulfoscipio gibsoniae]AGL01089.1 hypothetical protein Desgi_1610 [Desulfoscipio gibsoniae DSM 7213]